MYSLIPAILAALYFVSAAQRQEQCSGLEDLARNVNPVFLANCIQESDCTKVTCQTREDLRNFFTAILFTPLPCLPRPGVRIQALDRGNVIYEEIFIYRDGGINATRSQFSTLSLQVSVESTARSIELTISPLTIITSTITEPSPTYLINTTSISIDRCGCESICCADTFFSNESGTTYEWPETSVGAVATFNCPLSPGFTVTRECGAGGEWQSFDRLGCGVVNFQLSRLENLFSSLTAENYEMAVSQLLEVIEQSQNDPVEQNSAVLVQVSSYISQASAFVMGSNVTVNSSIINGVLHIVDSLSQWQPVNVEAESVSTTLESFEAMASVYAQQLQLNEEINFVTPSLTLVAELRGIKSLLKDGRSFAIGDNKTLDFNMDNYMEAGELPPSIDSAIILPSSLFKLVEDKDNISTFFVHYDKSTLFPVNTTNKTNDNSTKRTEVGSTVLAATVGRDVIFRDLDQHEANVTILFRLDRTQGKFLAPDSEVCVSWNFDLQRWTPDGCMTSVDKDKKVVKCSCSHLTNFAVLVDICLRREDCDPCDHDYIYDRALTYISYIGMSISIFFLIITIFTLLCSKNLRKKEPSIYHIQLSLAILLMLIVAFVLVAFSARDLPAPLYEGCMTVSVLVHYFTLVAVMWMGAEALLMFLKLVIVFVHTKKYTPLVSLTCWGVPICVVVIPLALDLFNVGGVEEYLIIKRVSNTTCPTDHSEPSYCFLSHAGVFWGTFLAPIFAVMVFNLVVFVCVIVVLIRYKMGRIARKQERMTAKTALRLMFSVGGVMLLFGLTWLFAILTFSASGVRETFQLLFTVFNSLQGFFIFVFVLNEEILTCCRKAMSKRSSTSRSRSGAQRHRRIADKSRPTHSTGVGSQLSHTHQNPSRVNSGGNIVHESLLY